MKYFFTAFIGGALASFVTTLIIVGLVRLKWKIEDWLLDSSIEKAYPELKGKLK